MKELEKRWRIILLADQIAQKHFLLFEGRRVYDIDFAIEVIETYLNKKLKL